MKTILAASLAAVMLAAPASLALADDDYRGSVSVSKEQALEIARGYGLDRLKEIELDDGEWEIEGCTADGYEIEIDVNARSGRVTELEIDRDDRC